jgi:phage terminase large subunit-like protein
MGLDLASRSDLTALALWFPEDDGTWQLRVECWVPSASMAERARTAHVPYPEWRAAGWLQATPGNSTDYAFIERRIYELMALYDVVEIGVDPWNARDLLTRLQDNRVPIVEVEQTVRSLSAASKELERLVLTRRVRHEASPVMRWMVGNAVVVIDANENIRPDKKRSREKIDGVSAAVTGLSRAMIPNAGSVYASRGLLTVG